MQNKIIFLTGVAGVSFFVIASVLGGFQFDNYDPVSQYISETMAIDTPYGKALRFFGYIPSGILLTIFGFLAARKFQQYRLAKIGFYGIAIFYGIATVVVGIFPCDKGCNKELIDPSASQLIHNLTGFLTYIFVPISILMIGISLKRYKEFKSLSGAALICGLFCMFFIWILLSNPLTDYAGLLQRVIEGTFAIWIIICAVFFRKQATV